MCSGQVGGCFCELPGSHMVHRGKALASYIHGFTTDLTKGFEKMINRSLLSHMDKLKGNKKRKKEK
jgi:hypothetical protein